MASLRITKTVSEAYKQLFAHLNEWFSIAIVPVAVTAALDVIQMYLGSDGFMGTAIGLVFQVISAVFSACIYIAWIRAVDSSFATVEPVAPISPSPTERKFFLSAVTLIVIPSFVIAIIFGAGMTSMSLEPNLGGSVSQMGGLRTGVLLGLAVAAIVYFVSVRLSFYFVDLALGLDREPVQAFTETQGHGFGIFFAVIMALIPVAIAGMFLSLFIFGLFGLTIAAIIVLKVVSAFSGAFGAVLSSSIIVQYRHAAKGGV